MNERALDQVVQRLTVAFRVLGCPWSEHVTEAKVRETVKHLCDDGDPDTRARETGQVLVTFDKEMGKTVYLNMGSLEDWSVGDSDDEDAA